MDTIQILKRLCRRLYFVCAIIVVCITFVLYLKSGNVSKANAVYVQNDIKIPTTDQHDFKTKSDASEESTNSKSSLEFIEKQQAYTSPPDILWTSGNLISLANNYLSTTNESPVNSSHHQEKEHSYNKNIYPIIDSNHSMVINRNHTKSPRTLPIPETCQTYSMKGAKIVLLWTPFFGTWDYFPQENFQLCSHCRNCQIITDRSKIQESDAVIFHARDISLFDLPPVRNLNQRWIFYSLESPPYSDFPGLQHMKNMFNWTMTYRTDSNIVVRYGAVVKNQQPKQIDLQSLQKYFGKKSKSVVWMTSHCPTFGGRDEYVAEMRKYIDVDVYGTCGTSVCPPGDTEKCLKEYADKYKFFLAFENTICKDYITEKLFRNLNYDIIPVVFGGADYDRFVPPGSYINALSFQSPKHLALFMSGTGKDFNLYSSYFKWRENFSLGIINRKECDLCTMLHRKDLEESSYEDLRKWWVTDSQCYAWEPK